MWEVAVRGASRSSRIDCDGSVGLDDLLLLLAAWGPCKKSSETTPALQVGSSVMAGGPERSRTAAGGAVLVGPSPDEAWCVRAATPGRPPVALLILSHNPTFPWESLPGVRRDCPASLAELVVLRRGAQRFVGAGVGPIELGTRCAGTACYPRPKQGGAPARAPGSPLVDRSPLLERDVPRRLIPSDHLRFDSLDQMIIHQPVNPQ